MFQCQKIRDEEKTHLKKYEVAMKDYEEGSVDTEQAEQRVEEARRAVREMEERPLEMCSVLEPEAVHRQPQMASEEVSPQPYAAAKQPTTAPSAPVVSAAATIKQLTTDPAADDDDLPLMSRLAARGKTEVTQEESTVDPADDDDSLSLMSRLAARGGMGTATQPAELRLMVCHSRFLNGSDAVRCCVCAVLRRVA